MLGHQSARVHRFDCLDRTVGSSFRPPRQTSFNPQISTGSVGPATGNPLKDLKDLKDLSLDMNFKQ